MTDPSEELREAARTERAIIRMDTEARILRDEVAAAVGEMQRLIDRYDEDPEGGALSLVVITGLLAHSLAHKAAQVARRLKEDL